MKTRRVAPIAAPALCAALLSGCVGEPAPVETIPLFANEGEAFTAAEATYRAYVDALNQVDLSDPETLNPLLSWTTDAAKSDDQSKFASLQEQGLTVAGDSAVVSAELLEYREIAGNVGIELGVCLDVHDVTLDKADGTSAVSLDRPEIQAIRVSTVASADTTTGFVIAQFGPADGAFTCA